MREDNSFTPQISFHAHPAPTAGLFVFTHTIMKNHDHDDSLVNHTINTLLESDATSVVREGKIFVAGDYPERGFTLSDAELLEAAGGFVPIPIKLQHVDTPLDGKLGALESLRVVGSTLFGRARLPLWLDRLVPEKRVSCGWDRATKRLTELSLVTEPRIADAVLYAAGELPDDLSRHLAVPTITTNDTDQTKEINPPMNVKEWLTRLRVLFSSMPTADADDTNANIPEERQDQPSLLAEIEALRADRRKADATAFADNEIRSRRAFPAERNPLIAAFLQAAVDDERLPAIATFNDETPINRVESLRALQGARPPHPLTEELLDPARPAKALFHEQKTGAEIDPETRRAELLSQTRLGRDILKTEKRK
jgi:hypothetical protein